MKNMTTFSGLLEGFFTDRLMRQQQASPRTIASYRDAFRLLFQFVQKHLNKSPSSLVIEDINSKLVVDFLCWLEDERQNSARSETPVWPRYIHSSRMRPYMIQFTVE